MTDKSVQNPNKLVQQIHIQIPPKCCSIELAVSHVENWVTFRRTLHPSFPLNISPIIAIALECEDLTHDTWQRIRGRIPLYVELNGVLMVSTTDTFEHTPLKYADVVLTDNPEWLEHVREILINPIRTEISIEFIESQAQ